MIDKNVPEVQKEGGEIIKREVTRNPEKYVSPLVDIYETDESLVLVADLPGVDKESLEIKVDEGILTIEAHMKHVDSKRYLAREFHPVSFFRQFEVYETVNQNAINASLVNGVLTLTLPKAEKQKPRQIEVKVS
ncbi:MAG: Hsp20/alpha crystallin family protein [Candidatus Riflebacteria bacterium]|nr:Hsp20/alpha crystallin family protein [Candidatus Riflebacteria bacterium]